MKVSVRDFRGCDRAEIDASGITLLVGDGGSSKTSICMAVAAAGSGQILPVDGLTKGRAGILVRNGTDHARSEIVSDTGRATIRWPQCEYEVEGDAPYASPFAVGLKAFSGLAEKERATVLREYVAEDPTPTKDDLTSELKEYRVSAEVAEVVWKTIDEHGWDAAHVRAKEKGAQLKGQWQEVTGENYGSKKAESWRPEGFDEGDPSQTDEGNEESFAAEVEGTKRRLERAIAQQAVSEAELAAHRAAASATVPNIAALRSELSTALAELEEAKSRRAGLPPATNAPGVPCPHCGGSLHVYQGRLSKAETIAAPELKKREAAILSADKEVTRLEEKVSHAESSLSDAERAAANRDAAARKLSDAEARTGGEDPEGVRSSLAAAEAKLAAYRKWRSAKKHHRSILINQAIIDVLDPTGLRRRKLLKLLERLSDEVFAPLCKVAGWKPVTINEALEVCYGGRTFGMLCRSEKKRADIVMQIGMARVDKSALIVIDDAEFIPMGARKGLIMMLAETGIPSIVAMMVPSPGKVPDLTKAGLGKTYWVQDGLVTPVDELQQRKAA